MNPFYINGGKYISSENVRVADNQIEIQHFSAVLKVLRHFGLVISKLGFSIAYATVNIAKGIAQIHDSIGMYCADTLIEFHIDSFHPNFFDKFSKPFKQVESVYIIRSSGGFDSKTLSFEKLFPAIRKLSLTKVVTFDAYDIAQIYPNLKELTITIGNDTKTIRQEHVHALLEKNPQIDSLKLKSYTRSFLQNVSQVVANLKRLEIEEYISGGANDSASEMPITFYNVKHLAIISWNSVSVPENVRFPNLIEFTIDANSKINDRWINMVHNFAQNSTTFVKLKVMKMNYARVFLGDRLLGKLSKQKFNIEEAHLTIDEDVKDETILNFIQINDKLQKIHLTRFIPRNSFEGIVQIIQQKHENDWEIVKTETNYEIKLEKII